MPLLKSPHSLIVCLPVLFTVKTPHSITWSPCAYQTHFDPMVDFCMSFAHKERAEDELEEILLNHLINLRVKQQGNITAANVTRFNAYRKRYLNRRKCPTMKRKPTGHCDFGKTPASGACEDDIGSPVMCESSRRWFLVGWVGTGLCGTTPDVVSNYTFYQKWIEHIVSLQ